MKLFRSTALVSALTFCSRILGLVREALVARWFGVSAATDAFYIAFRIPNMLRQLFAEGSFSMAFVPMLAEYKAKGDRAALKEFIDRMTGTLLAVLMVITGTGVLAAPVVVSIFAPGFLDDPERFELATEMLRLTMPYILLVSLTGLAGSILNSHQRFMVPALTPILLNVSLIGATVWLSSRLAEPVTALAWGVLVGGIVQLLAQIPSLLRLGLLPRPRWGFGDAGVRRTLKLMVPTLFSSSVYQVNLLVDGIIASFLITGAISWLYQAERLLQFPLGVFGVALSTVILPHLSGRHAEADGEAFARSLLWGVRTVLIIAVPAALTMLILPEMLVWTLYGYGKYGAHDVTMASLSLAALAFGLPSFLLIKVLAPGFYARQDPKTPVKAALTSMGSNMLLNAIIVGTLVGIGFHAPHMGLTLASALAGAINAGLLWHWLKRDGMLRVDAAYWQHLRRLLLAGLVLAGWFLWVKLGWADWPAWRGLHRVAAMLGILAVGGGLYLGTLWLLGLRPRDVLDRRV